MTQTSLQEKTEQSLTVLRQIAREYDYRHIAVAWTGGKDSTVVLDLWRQVCPGRVVALNLDTGCKFPEVMAFRDEWGAKWDIDLLVARPGVADNYPLAQDKVSCCKDLKIDPLNRALAEHEIQVLLTGIRRDEHPSRMHRTMREQRTSPDHVAVHPVLEFTEMDVWGYTMQQGLPHCSLYDLGYRSLGCMPCTARPGEAGQAAEGDERAGRDREKEKNLEHLHSLGYF